SGAIGFGANRVESIADAVAKALEIHVQAGEEEGAHEAPPLAAAVEPLAAPATAADPALDHSHGEAAITSRDLCPSCGSASLLNVEGCKTCSNCGYSKCS